MRILLISIFLFSFSHAQSGLLDVVWPKPNLKQQKPSIPYPSVLTQGIKNTALPIYIPSNYAYDKKMIVVAEQNFYAISFLLDGAIINISGDKTYQETISSENPEFSAITKNTAPVEYNKAEGIVTANFNKHNVNYILSIECDDPESDQRCTISMVSTLYSKLIMVGGKQ